MKARLLADKFKENFHKYKDKKIVLYGIGTYTITLLEDIQDYNIIGLLDRDNTLIGTKKYGLTILDRQTVESQADLIIISTAESYWRVIYARIKDWNLPIYTADGRLAKDVFSENTRDNAYWEKSRIDLESTIDKYDIVSFDIFDTLLMRKIYNPSDVFSVVERRLKKEYGKNFTYLELRNKAMALLYNPTIDELYEKMQRLSGWDDEKINHIKEVEIDTDRKLITPRKDMVEIFKNTSKKKKVFLISDMYYTTEILLEILADVGILINPSQIIVSCDYRAQKEDGSLWKRYKEEFVGDKKALHIGDNVQADGERARFYDIDTYLIMSAASLLENSSFSKCIADINSIEASLYIGVLTNKIFNSPFSLCETRGGVNLRDDHRAGYCLYGGVTYAFIMWLIERSKKDEIHQLLFGARDGFFLIKAYAYICNLLPLTNVPEAIYFETSRRVLTTIAIYTEADIKEELLRRRFAGTMQELLYNRFNIVVDECDEKINHENMDNMIDKIVQRYGKKILNIANKERERYCCYLKDLDIKQSAAIVDTGYVGTIQYLLNKVLGKKVKGYYCYADLRDSNVYYKNNMQGCFQMDNDKAAENSEVYKKHLYLEAFFTAPNGTFLYIDDKGKNVYGEKMSNQKYFDVRYVMFEGILEFISDMVYLYKSVELEYYENDYQFIDKMFGRMIDEGFAMSDRIKNSFYFDDRIEMSAERPLWR